MQIIKGGSPMKNDVEDIPMVYLLYVLLAIVVAVGIAAVVILRLITLTPA
jgi:hypothetical protein